MWLVWFGKKIYYSIMIMIFSPLFLNYIISSILSCGVRWWRAYIYFCPAPVVFHRHNQKPYLDGSLLVLRQKHALFSKNGWCAHACPFYNYALGTLSNNIIKTFLSLARSFREISSRHTLPIQRCWKVQYSFQRQWPRINA